MVPEAHRNRKKNQAPRPRCFRSQKFLAFRSGLTYEPPTLGAFRGNLTFSRFYVTGDIPDDIPGTALRRIRANAFQPLSPEEDKSEGFGWANMEDPVDTDLDHEKVFYNEYVCLSFRLDKWAIPTPLLKAHLREAEQALLEKRGLEKLGRQAKADLKTMVVRKLRRQLVPSLKSYDMVWNLNTHIVHFHSQAEKIISLFDDSFKKTFKLDLIPESPGTSADRVGLDARQSAAMAGLEPTTLARIEEES